MGPVSFQHFSGGLTGLWHPCAHTWLRVRIPHEYHATKPLQCATALPSAADGTKTPMVMPMATTMPVEIAIRNDAPFGSQCNDEGNDDDNGNGNDTDNGKTTTTTMAMVMAVAMTVTMATTATFMLRRPCLRSAGSCSDVVVSFCLLARPAKIACQMMLRIV